MTAGALPRATALVVDDVDDIRLLVRQVLTYAGFDVVEAGAGPQALAMLADGLEPDLVVLDVQMPEMDGWQTLGAIRAAPWSATVPVVLCTVKAQAIDELHGWQLGCDAFVAKPFSIDLLLDAVAGVMATGADERAIHRQAQIERVESELASAG